VPKLAPHNLVRRTRLKLALKELPPKKKKGVKTKIGGSLLKDGQH
jgi:hypothetical protein